MAAHALGHGRYSIHHDGGILRAEPDHAAAAARTRGRDGERGQSMGRHPQRGHVVCRGVRFAGVGARRRPPWPQADAIALKPRHRRVHRADGCGGERLAVFCVPRADGRVRRIFQRGHRIGGESGSGAAARLCSRLAQHRPARRLPGRAADRRGVSRLDRQLPHFVLLHLGDDLAVAGSRLVRRRRALCGPAQVARPAIDPQQPDRGGRHSSPVGAVFRAADGAIRGAHGAAGRDLICPANGRPRPDLATLSGIAFSVTGLANVIAAPFLGNRSDRIGYRRVLLICLFGATVTTLPQAFTENYWVFTAQRFGVGLFIGGLLPTANALVGRLVPRAERGAMYGITASATFLGNSLGPLTGGAVAAAFGLRWVFLVTAAVLLANLLWVYYRVPEYTDHKD